MDLSGAVRGEASPAERPIFCDALSPRWGAGTDFRMIRWRQYKYVAFRDAPPLFFDLAADPGEQRNLLDHKLSVVDSEALAYLAQVAADTMDFEAAEWERLVRDGDLKELYAQGLPQASGNLYLFPDGRLVNADDVMLTTPTVLADDPAVAFGDWPGGDSEGGLPCDADVSAEDEV